MVRIYTKAISSFLVASFITFHAYADASQDPYYFGEHHMMWGNWFAGPMMMLFMLVILVIAAIVVAKLLGFGAVTGGKAGEADGALAILNERFAKGEIDKADYEDRKKTLLS